MFLDCSVLQSSLIAQCVGGLIAMPRKKKGGKERERGRDGGGMAFLHE